MRLNRHEDHTKSLTICRKRLSRIDISLGKCFGDMESRNKRCSEVTVNNTVPSKKVHKLRRMWSGAGVGVGILRGNA